MSRNLPPTQTLSSALEESIHQRRVKVAVFTTFTLEPGFFEEDVLPLLFDQAWSHMPKVRLVQLEEALRTVEEVAVYYDRNALMTGGTSAMLDVRRVPVVRDRSGCFHPKLILLLVENQGPETEETRESLIVGVLSANLTCAGWWENVECATFHEVMDGDVCSFKKDLLQIMRQIRRSSPEGERHESLDRIKKFLQHSVRLTKRRKQKGLLRPRLFGGQETLGDFLAERLKHYEDTYNLEIVSPYFDDSEDARTLRELIEVIAPKRTRVYLPRSDDGTAQCGQPFFEAVAELPGVEWGMVPHSMIQRSARSKDNQTNRFVHAKIYRLWSRAEGREYLLVGSANLTAAAHSRSRRGNLEAAMLMENPRQGKLSFWLDSIEKELPDRFCDRNPQREDQEELTAPLMVRFDWDAKRASYYWDRAEAPQKIALFASGVQKLVIDPVQPREMTALSAADGDTLASLLRSTSFLEVRVDDQSAGVIMVSEESMSQKPSLLMNLTAEEILRYWSLLTPEQRQSLIETGIARQLEKQGIKLNDIIQHSNKNSFFDRFAGVFHAFLQFEQHVNQALEKKRLADAEYRLFGEKHDSLPVYVRKVVEDEAEEDPVNRYVQLLTVKQLMTKLERNWPDFFRTHRTKKIRLWKMLDQTDRLKTRLDLGSHGEAAEFLDWFEKMFLAEARPLEVK